MYLGCERYFRIVYDILEEIFVFFFFQEIDLEVNIKIYRFSYMKTYYYFVHNTLFIQQKLEIRIKVKESKRGTQKEAAIVSNKNQRVT